MANQALRQKMKKADIRQWEVADELGVSEFTLTRWLRKELFGERKVTVLNTIRQLAEKKENCSGNKHIET